MASNELAADPTHTAQDDADAGPSPTTGARHRVLLWDLPLRLFHWALLAAVTTAIVTGKLGGEWMPLHGKAGIAIVGLLGFRLAWGLLGSSTARFLHFLPSPGALLSYLRGRWRGIGHNPLGALSVVALLGLIGTQAVTGLFGNDDIAFTGPLVGLVDESLSQSLTGWHHRLVNVLFVLLGLHVAAILFHVFAKKDNIVKPMVTGHKDVPADLPAPRAARRWALLLAVVTGLGATYAASGEWIKPDAPPPAAPAATGTATPTTAAPSW